MQIFLFIALLIAILAVVFALQNTGAVTITFLVWHLNGSLALVLIVAVAAGMLASFLALMPTIIRTSMQSSGHKRDKGRLEQSLAEFREKVEALQKQLDEASTAGEEEETSQDS